MSIIPSYQSGPIHKSLFTGALCFVIPNEAGFTYGLLAKGISLLIAPHLHKALGTKKVNEIYADLIGSGTTYGVFFVAVKMGFVATPIPLTSAIIATGLSVSVTLLSIKVVYVTFSTFFFCVLKDNGMLDKAGNYLSQPLYLISGWLLGSLYNALKDSREKNLEDWRRILNYNISRGLLDFPANFFTYFCNKRRILEMDQSIFFYTKEKINSLTHGTFIIKCIFVIEIILWSLFQLFSVPMTALLNLTTYTSQILLGCYFLVPAVGLILKAVALLDPSTRNKFWDAVQMQLKELDEESGLSRLSPTLMRQMESKIEQEEECPLFNLPEDILFNIASRLDQEKELYRLLTTSSQLYAVAHKYFKHIDGKKSIIRHYFSQPILEKIDEKQFLDMPISKIKAHRMTRFSEDGKANDEILTLFKDITEGGMNSKDPYSSPPIMKRSGGDIFSFCDQIHFGSHKFVWGIDPFPFIAFRTLYKGLFRKREGVIVFHRCMKTPEKQFWGISHSDGSLVEVADTDAKFASFLEKLQDMLKFAKIPQLDPIEFDPCFGRL